MKPTVWLGLVLLLFLAACSGSGEGEAGSGPAANPATAGMETDAASGQAPEASGETNGSPVEPNDSEDPVKLVAATYYLSDQLEAAVKKYEELHPDIDIELHAVSTMGKDLNDVMNKQEQFIKTNNAALLAGKGPDVIELDQLPFEQYVKRGLLVDLREWMNQDPDFRKENYFAHIIDHAQIGGVSGLYGMPLYFSLVGLFGDAEAIEQAGVSFDDDNWTLNDFIDTARKLVQNGDRSHVYTSEERYFLERLVVENFSQLVNVTNGNAEFDAEALAELMKQVRGMSEDGLLHNMRGDARGAAAAEPGSGSHDLSYFMDTELYSLRDALLYAPFPRTELYAKPHPPNAGGGGYFQPIGILGINANSDHPQEAWDFIRFLLDDENVQSHIDEFLDASPGFPINRSVYERQMDKLLGDGAAERRHGPAVPVDPAMLEQVDRYITEAVHSVGGPSRLSEIVRDGSEAFFAGQKPAEEAAKLIAGKINLLLNE